MMIEPRRPLDYVPLTFTQTSHWTAYQLRHRPAMREVALALCLRGKLSIALMQQALEETVQRHEALRTRIRALNGMPVQEILSGVEQGLEFDDLTVLPESNREVELRALAEKTVLEPIDIARDSLFCARIVKLRPDEHVLILAMNHLIADAMSLTILHRDLVCAYDCAAGECGQRLPALRIQFGDYAVWQQATHSLWLKKHEAYWLDRFAGYGRLTFPRSIPVPEGTSGFWGFLSFRIERSLKAELRKCCRRQKTTLVMGVFTIYVALVMRWCETGEAIVRFHTDGRAYLQLRQSIGFFASILNLRIELLRNDTFADLLRRVTKEFCNASAHADFAYLESRVPRPEFTRNSIFNWIPAALGCGHPAIHGSMEVSLAQSVLPTESTTLAKIDLDNEPIVTLHDEAEEIRVDIAFSRNRFAVTMIEDFGRTLLAFAKAMTDNPDARVEMLKPIHR